MAIGAVIFRHSDFRLATTREAQRPTYDGTRPDNRFLGALILFRVQQCRPGRKIVLGQLEIFGIDHLAHRLIQFRATIFGLAHLARETPTADLINRSGYNCAACFNKRVSPYLLDIARVNRIYWL
jgi:hypothetical protein